MLVPGAWLLGDQAKQDQGLPITRLRTGTHKSRPFLMMDLLVALWCYLW